MARLLVDAGLVVVCMSSVPCRAVRRDIRGAFQEGEYLEVHLASPPSCYRSRDVRGGYVEAVLGRIPTLSGVHVAFETTEESDSCVSVEHEGPDLLALTVVRLFRTRGGDC